MAHVRVGRGWSPVALLRPAAVSAGAAGPTVRLGAQSAVALGHAKRASLVVTYLPVLLGAGRGQVRGGDGAGPALNAA